MADERNERPVLYSPDSPNTAYEATPDGDRDRRSAEKDKARADDLAAKLAIADELSGYEKVAGRGVAEE